MDGSQILLVNFELLVQKSLYEILCRAGYKVDIASETEEALECISEKPYQIVLTDLNKEDDVELVKDLKDKLDSGEVIILTSYGNLDFAVRSIKLGAFDYLVRPVEDEKIISVIERALLNLPRKKTHGGPFKKLSKKSDDSFHGIIGKSDKLNEIYSVVERIANAKTTILIRGESGTGKRLLAHSIHKADKKRCNKPFVEVSCGALPRDIVESELFGHTKGAFTGAIADRKGRFELAHGGTILLDDIDSLTPDLQVKLLRIIQQKEFERVGDHRTVKVDARIVAATNQDLEKLVSEKKFREDLYYRLNVISIVLPPLRERKEDLPSLLEHFVNLYSKENHKKLKGMDGGVIEVLKNYHWPGNIRELENIIERAVILDTDGVINKDDLPEILISKTMANVSASALNLLKDILREPEKGHILRILKEVGWNKKKAAKKLGINRTTLYNKLRKYNLISQG
ncbi:MAG: sigma-54-dependent Fis family transcriptional regulator [Candidatus Omnitrophica bacterium]|nr:sigma-54-dependent Fis family transcriptional regulator [Candidatus Omnitrophota bacterium]